MGFALLIVLAAAVLLVAALLGLDIAGVTIRSVPGFPGLTTHQPGWRLLGTGVLVVSSVAWISLFTLYRDWPYGHRHTVNQDLLPLILAGMLLIIAGTMRRARAHRAAAEADQPATRLRAGK